MVQSYDAVVVGGGPGGYVCAIRLGQAGLKTLVVERARLGGVCLNVGCIPSKALIHASKVYRKAKDGQAIGVVARDLSVDLAAMVGWKDGITARLSAGVGALLKGNKVEVIAGSARLLGDGRVLVTKADGALAEVEARAIVLATGSVPISIPGFSVDQQTILDSTGALALTEIPKAMAVLGGGVIGMELGDVFARLGTEVTVVEALDRVLTAFDADLVLPVVQKQAKLGVRHLTGHRAVGWRRGDDGRVLLSVRDGQGKEREIVCDKVLVAVGRRPASADLGLDAAGVRTDANGFVPVDAQLRTNVPGIYAIGDLAGNPMLAHKASMEGEVCAEVIAGRPGAAVGAVCIPNVVYTDPEIATVGPQLFELQAEGRAVRAGKFPFAALGRALTAQATVGFARTLCDAKTGAIVSVQVVGAEASELIAAGGLAVEMAATAEDVALTVHAHPTLAEALVEAAHAATGHPLHQLK